MATNSFKPDDVLSLWFPDTGHQNSLETHGAFWDERMQGGMDDQIIARFADLTAAAATGQLDTWAETPYGRLALLIALDQFPRSLWRGTPAAFGQDIKAAGLALDGIENGDFAQLLPWEQSFFIISITHCEGPEHLQRMDWLTDIVQGVAERFPDPLAPLRAGLMEQHMRVRGIIEKFGRHPHRNDVLGRLSSPDEVTYIATGDFPHVRRVETLQGSAEK